MQTITTPQIIFFDIDNTLLDWHSHAIPDSAQEALNHLKDAGHYLCISTGRTFYGLPEEIEALTWDGFCCVNGQSVFTGDGQLIHAEVYPKELVQACLALAKDFNTPLMIKDETHVFMTGQPSEAHQKMRAALGMDLPPVEAYQGQPIAGMMVFESEGGDCGTAFSSIPGLHAFNGGFDALDLIPDGISKAVGARHLVKYYGMEDFIAFGDSDNDVDIVKAAKVGVAMGQGAAELKAVADYVTTPVDQDGILNACLALGLI